MGDKRTPDNHKPDEIKGGGNPFVDYDFYLHSERSGGRNPSPEKKNQSASGGLGQRSASPRPSQRSAQPSGGKPAQKSGRPLDAFAKNTQVSKPWYIRARDAIVRFYSTKRPLKVTLTVVIALILIAVIVVLSFAYGILGMANTNATDESRDAVFENESNFAMMTDPTSQSFRAALKEWANSGEKMHSKNVVNVLLVGMDESGMRSDSMIIASVNKKTQTVTLASVYRDCFTYANINDQDRYLKLNQVAQYASLNRTVETIENNFKIEIDDYVAVDFASFPDAIDAVGGVTIDITDDEYRWLLNHEGVNVGGSGSQKLNGEEALAYCRIRYLDSDGDVSRTERQRKVIASLIDAGKGASMGQVTDLLDAVLPKVTTNMSRTGILSLATQALTGQWYNYQVKSIDVPSENARQGQDGASTSVESGAWVWLVDYPLAAQELQMALYGSSNVELEEGRLTMIDIYYGRSASGGGGSSGGSGWSSGDDDSDEPSRSSGGSDDNPDTEETQTERETETETQTERVTETEESTEDDSTTTEPPRTTDTQPDEGGDNGGEEPEA